MLRHISQVGAIEEWLEGGAHWSIVEVAQHNDVVLATVS